MGAIEDYVAALAGPEIQKQIAAQNPYFQLQGVPDTISQLTQQMAMPTRGPQGLVPSQYKTGDLITLGLLGGLGSGLLGGLGQDYQGTLTDRYQQALLGSASGLPVDSSNLPPSLFRTAQDQARAFQLKKGLELKDLINKEKITNPEQAQEAQALYPEMFGGKATAVPLKSETELFNEAMQTGDTSQLRNAEHIKTVMQFGAKGAATLAAQDARQAAIEAKKEAVAAKSPAIAAMGGIESMDRLINMVDTLPDNRGIKAFEGVLPITNSVNFFDDQAKSVSAALAKQLEGRVNEVVLKSYMTSMARQTGDTNQDIKNRLVNAQLWLSRIAQGDTKALKMDPAEFARQRGVDPSTIGIRETGGSIAKSSPSAAPAVGGIFDGKKITSVERIQ